MTSDGYALEVIRAGRDLGITPRGIVIGLATVLVESGPMPGTPAGPILMYANEKIPASLLLPHDAVGRDGLSCGLQQQQLRKGVAGEWWWGPLDVIMDPYRSSRLFFERLAKRDYMRGDAGAHAQAVQGSAFPDRYGQRMDEAQQLYNRLSGGVALATYYDKDRSSEFGFGGPRSVSGLRGICIHTTESAPGASADDVTSYQIRSRSGSYNVMVGEDGLRILQNTDDWIVWATGNQGNNILLHLCFVGRSAWSRSKWLSNDRQLRAGATVVKHWADKYGFPLRKVSAAGLPGILGHVDTRVWGSTDHTDPGPNFPYDRLIELARGAAPVAPPVNQIDVEAKAASSWLGDRVTKGEIVCPDKVGRFAQFANGYVYWSPRSGAHAVPLHIFEAWAGRGWEAGALGYPVKGHTVIPDVGDIQAFQGGTLYRRYGEPGYLVKGVIGKRWASEGFEAGPLGWPTSDEYDFDDGKRQSFQHGMLTWSPSGAVKELS